MADTLKMTVPGQMEYIKTAKLAVSSMAGIAGFDYDSLEDIRIAVGEACKCITCHNQECWSSEYELTATVDEKALTITVVCEKTAHTVPKGHRICLDCPREGDLAMEIIKSVMDEMILDKDGEGFCKITMVKNK